MPLLALLLLLSSAEAFVAPAALSYAPAAHGRAPPSSLFFDTLFPTKAPPVPWSDSYAQRDIDALWNTMRPLYGSDKAARAAVQQNSQVICPLYSTPATMKEAYTSLVKLVGREDAREIMGQNPAILQCGDLSGEDPAQLRKAAAARVGMDNFARFLQGNP